jgi:hypothetical protein
MVYAGQQGRLNAPGDRYGTGFAIPMMVGTCLGALSCAASLAFTPETKGKVLVLGLVVA